MAVLGGSLCARSGVTDIHEGNWAVTAIKCTVISAPALHDATLTTQLDGLHFVYSSDVGLLRCWYLLAAVNISVWMYKHDLHSFSYIYDIFTVKM